MGPALYWDLTSTQTNFIREKYYDQFSIHISLDLASNSIWFFLTDSLINSEHGGAKNLMIRSSLHP